MRHVVQIELLSHWHGVVPRQLLDALTAAFSLRRVPSAQDFKQALLGAMEELYHSS